jgi:hypothetical protein
LLSKFWSAIWQGGVVTAMTINYGVLLGFVPSNGSEVGQITTIYLIFLLKKSSRLLFPEIIYYTALAPRHSVFWYSCLLVYMFGKNASQAELMVPVQS